MRSPRQSSKACTKTAVHNLCSQIGPSTSLPRQINTSRPLTISMSVPPCRLSFVRYRSVSATVCTKHEGNQTEEIEGCRGTGCKCINPFKLREDAARLKGEESTAHMFHGSTVDRECSAGTQFKRPEQQRPEQPGWIQRWANAWARSAFRSSTSSTPAERRMRLSVIPRRWRCFGERSRCDEIAG